MADLPRLGAEEEFHVVDLRTGYAAPEVDTLLDQLDGAEFAPELQRSLVETNTPICGTLDELRGHLRRLRARLEEAAAPLGLGVVAAGTVPLVDTTSEAISAGARYERMQHEYQMLVREQHICGAQVHVDVPDRDTAVQVLQRVAPHLPTLLALTASSPYWHGHDSGYSSFRSIVWSRWPTAGPPAHVESAAEYDALVADLISSGTISDAGMVYFDVRPSAHLPTVELRVCDACPDVEAVVLVAGLFRAMVMRAVAEAQAGAPLPTVQHELLRAASWRAARSGLEGDLVEFGRGRGDAPSLVPPPQRVHRMLDDVRPELEELGDWDQVCGLAEAMLAGGSAAALQRRAFGRRGELTDVVAGLVERTQGRTPAIGPPRAVPPRSGLFDDYHAPGFDEVLGTAGIVRPEYGWLVHALDRMGRRGLAAAEGALRTEQQARGVTFRVGDDEPDRLFPLDVVPRILTADEWEPLARGLAQRVRALEAFLHDVYGAREIVDDGIVPAAVVEGAPGLHRAGRSVPADAVRVTVAGIDLVRDDADSWLVLEDNLRVPSGIGYGLISRRLIRSAMPDLEPPEGVVEVDGVPRMLRAALLSATDPDQPGADSAALLTAGPHDSAYFEHRLLAERMDVPLVTPRDLQVTDDGVHLVGPGGRRRLAALYRRIDEAELLAAHGAGDRPIGRALVNAVDRGTVVIGNALGNGVADDKLVYAYVPQMIEFYLGEKPLLASVPTFPCIDADAREQVLDRAAELVLKPVDGYGGRGIVIGPQASRQELAEVVEAVRADPAGWVAQEVVALSTHPVFDGTRLRPRAVDLRAFAFQSGTGDRRRVAVAPVALSRVAPEGSMIVNSSQGGGAKDTWVLRRPS
ncbi:glutamate--cysteine ligase [Pseudonocardia sp. CA-107938]|uniref:glutamate--cysteine ligase n=1 Tax=Pseudonocardia sp. CA-107938 TaxID=3240021 RepID=UPI003D8BBA91